MAERRSPSIGIHGVEPEEALTAANVLAVIGQTAEHIDALRETVEANVARAAETEARHRRAGGAPGARRGPSRRRRSTARCSSGSPRRRSGVAHLLEARDGEGGGIDAETRARLRSIDTQVLRILDDLSPGRQDLVTEIRQDIAGLDRGAARRWRRAGGSEHGDRAAARQRFSAIIWPGFVDVMTALILVLFFVLSIFMIVQFVLRDTITGQGQQLEELSVQVANLADALGLERSRADRQAALVTTLTGETRRRPRARIAALTGESEAAAARIADFEAQVASLIARNTDLGGAADRRPDGERRAAERQRGAGGGAGLGADRARHRGRGGAAGRGAARGAGGAGGLAAPSRAGAGDGRRAARLSEAEAARLAEAAAAEELRRRLEGADAELTAMTLSLEAERKKAEDTLTLLAAAEAARKQLAGSSDDGADRGAAARRRARAGQHPARRAAGDLGRGPAAGGAAEPADRVSCARS